MMNLRRVAAAWSLHLWKRQIATPPLTRTAPFSTDDGDSEKAKLFEKLHCLTSDYLDQISREQGVSLTGSDLADWAKSLSGDGNHERALEIYQWMEKNNMEFSPSDLENFVDLLCHNRGLVVAQAYLRKLDPGFSSMDPTAKNLPAFKMILKRLLMGSSHIFLTRDTFSDALIKVGASLVYLAGDVVRGGSGGSRFFINRNTIVTTYNVLLKLRAPYYIGKEIVVTLYTGAIVIGIISSYDSDRDLCLINIHDSKIEGINITWSKFSSDQPKQGQLVGALGAPLLLPNSFSMGAIRLK